MNFQAHRCDERVCGGGVLSSNNGLALLMTVMKRMHYSKVKEMIIVSGDYMYAAIWEYIRA